MNNTDTPSSDGTVQTNRIRLSSLQDLKAIFLAMDWEINDQTLNKLVSESEKLMVSSEGDLVLVAFFKMLSSIGKYIKKNKANADKDVIGLLGSVFESMEKVISEKAMPDHERKQLVVAEITKFQVLKQRITGARINPSIKKRMVQSATDEAIKAVKKEVAALRDEVAELRQKLEKAIAG